MNACIASEYFTHTYMKRNIMSIVTLIYTYEA